MPDSADAGRTQASPGDRLRVALRVAAFLAAVAVLIALLVTDRETRRRLRVPEGAWAASAVEGDNPRVEATLLLDAESVRPGEPFRAGVLLEMDRGWHVYGRNPGDQGLPTRLEWQIEGARVSPVVWPTPRSFRDAAGRRAWGYAGRVVLATEVAFPEDASGERRIEVEARFLACGGRCVPGRVRLFRRVLVGDTVRPDSGAVGSLLAAP